MSTKLGEFNFEEELAIPPVVEGQGTVSVLEGANPAQLHLKPELTIDLLGVNDNSSQASVSTATTTSSSSEREMVPDRDEDEDESTSSQGKADYTQGSSRGGGIFNFASHTAGAVVLGVSPSAKGFSNLLDDDMDRYGISPCNEKKWVVIGLSEDILVTSIVLANYEKYSSLLKEFQLLASTVYPTDEWFNLGTYSAAPRLGEQSFNVTQTSTHTRYVKIKFLSHYDNEALCTLSQVGLHLPPLPIPIPIPLISLPSSLLLKD